MKSLSQQRFRTTRSCRRQALLSRIEGRFQSKKSLKKCWKRRLLKIYPLATWVLQSNLAFGHSPSRLAIGPPALGQTKPYSVQPCLALAATVRPAPKPESFSIETHPLSLIVRPYANSSELSYSAVVINIAFCNKTKKRLSLLKVRLLAVRLLNERGVEYEIVKVNLLKWSSVELTRPRQSVPKLLELNLENWLDEKWGKWEETGRKRKKLRNWRKNKTKGQNHDLPFVHLLIFFKPIWSKKNGENMWCFGRKYIFW